MDRTTIFIGGEWVQPSGDATIAAVSPHTEEEIGRVAAAGTADVDRAVAAARAAFDEGPWPTMPASDRAGFLRAISAEIGARAQELAETMTAEMGTPASFSLFGQVMSASMILDATADAVDELELEQARPGLMGQCLVGRLPVGVAAGIAPWNVPVSAMATKLGAALGSGSTMVLKAAPEAPLSANLFAEVLGSVGLPPGVISVLVADRDVSEHLVRHPDLDKVSFTGSTAAGRRIGAICAEQVKRCTLELGGKSAAILLDDADIDAVAPQLIGAAFGNNGQTCTAQTRLLVPHHRMDEIAEAMGAAASASVVGDPADPTTTIGPLVNARQRDRVEGYIRAGLDEGARLVCGGGRPAGLARGFYVEPTVFADVDNHMQIAREEIFGPVLAIIGYDGDDDAIRQSNDSDYGLSGSVWGADVDRCTAVAHRLRTGTVAINSGLVGDIRTPFGGFRRSGIGREMGREGVEAYLETRTLVMPPG